MPTINFKTDQSGANNPLSSTNPIVFNFTLSGTYTIGTGAFDIKKGSSSSNGITATLYSGSNGTGSVLASVFVSQSSIPTSFGTVNFVINYADLGAGTHSLKLTTTDPSGGSTQYSIKTDSFQTVDAGTGTTLQIFDTSGNVIAETPTPTPSITPTTTPTISITPSITETITPTPTQTSNYFCYTVRQYLYGYDPLNGNSSLYVLSADYPNVTNIPVGATATINGTLVTVANVTASNSIYLQGGAGYTIGFNPYAGNISAGTYIEFCWVPEPTPSPTPTITLTPTISETPTITPSETPTNTPTLSSTETPTPTPSETPFESPPETPTPTPTDPPQIESSGAITAKLKINKLSYRNGSFKLKIQSNYKAGLYGVRYVGYHNDDPSWFATATPYGTNNILTSINNFTSSPDYQEQDYYSWEWVGYFKPSTTEEYTFYTNSDDGSYIWIGSSAIEGYNIGNAIVNNGGAHGPQETFGSINLTANIYYPIRIQFGEIGGGDIVTVSFSTNTISKTSDGNGYYFHL